MMGNFHWKLSRGERRYKPTLASDSANEAANTSLRICWSKDKAVDVFELVLRGSLKSKTNKRGGK